MVKFFLALQITFLALAREAWTNPTAASSFGSDPTHSVSSIQSLNGSDSTLQINLLSPRSPSDPLAVLAARQVACPSSSTNALCPTNFCFLSQQNSDGTVWGTCCLAGWSLILNSADWSTQKCVLDGTSEPPVRPSSCGGTVNGNVGTISGWACVYSNQNINGIGRLEQPVLLAVALALTSIGIWSI